MKVHGRKLIRIPRRKAKNKVLHQRMYTPAVAAAARNQVYIVVTIRAQSQTQLANSLIQ
jgi:hypothetical protein